MKRPLQFAVALIVLVTSASSQLPLSSVHPKALDLFEIGLNRSFTASASDGPASTSQPASPRETRRIMNDLAEAIEIIRANHISGKQVDLNSITKSAIGGALQALDPHSSYFDASEYNEFLTEEQSEYSGIGATIAGYWNNGTYDTFVTSVIAGSPAAAAKLAFGDRILKVDGQSFTGRSTDDVRDAVRGEQGRSLSLLVERAASGRVENLILRRRLVQQPSIRDTFMLNSSVGYIGMTEGFNYTTADEISASLKQLHKLGAKALVLDLRENPGGILEQAVRVAEKFLPASSTIVSQRGRSKLDNRVWKSANPSPENMPVVVLVNENSASASEILAGALQDHDRALVVGERTFGKGLVQSLYDGPQGTGLTLTTARYYTPSGRCIQRDYSTAGLYDYYNHRIPETVLGRTEAKTSSNRTVFGGDGIEPDVTVAPHRFTKTESEIDDAVFFFTRDLVNGRLGLQNKLQSKLVKTGLGVRESEDVDAGLFSEFVKFARSFSGSSAVSEDATAQREFISERINFYLTMANRGDTFANRLNIVNDLPVIKALAELPKAQSMALSARTATK